MRGGVGTDVVGIGASSRPVCSRLAPREERRIKSGCGERSFKGSMGTLLRTLLESISFPSLFSSCLPCKGQFCSALCPHRGPHRSNAVGPKEYVRDLRLPTEKETLFF